MKTKQKLYIPRDTLQDFLSVFGEGGLVELQRDYEIVIHD